MELARNFAKLFLMQNFNQEIIENPAPETPQEILLSETPTPNNPPWNNLTAFLVWIASVAFILIVPNVLVGIYLYKSGVNFGDRDALVEFIKTDPTTNILAIVAVIPAHILTIVLAWFVVTKFNKFSFRQTLGWRFGTFKIWYIFLIVGLFFALAGILTTYFGETDNDLLRILRTSRSVVYIVAFLATFTAPLIEEVVYRGILYSALQRSIGVAYAVVVVTLLFALVHVPQYYPDFVSISMILLLSLVLTLVRVRSGNLLPCIALHFVFNGIQSLLLILQPFFTENLNSTQDKAAMFFHLFK